MSRNQMILILILVAAVATALFVLLWRSPANAQQSIGADQLIATATKNMHVYGYELDAQFIGTVESVEETFELLSNANEAFFFMQDGKGIIRTLGSLLDKERGDDVWPELRRVMSGGLSVGDLLYSVNLGGAKSHLTVSRGGRAYSGVFALFSRLPIETYYSSQPRRAEEPDATTEEICAHRVFNRNIFGQAAEQIRACLRTYCSETKVAKCELIRIEPRSWFFGKVVASPEYAPAQGTIHGSDCRGPVRYKWGVGLGKIRTSDYGDFEVENFAMGGTGTIMPEMPCK